MTQHSTEALTQGMKTYQVAIFGGGGVGKTAITIQFVRGEFTNEYNPTIEDDYQKNFSVNGKTVSFGIIDTAGQEDLSAMRFRYMNASDAFVFVFSVDKKNSLEEVFNIYKECVEAKGGQIISVVAANKCDLPKEKHELNIASVKEQVSKIMDAKLFETSAKTNTNISQLFEHVATKLIPELQVTEKSGGGCCNIL